MKQNYRKWFRAIHRDLSYIFSGLILVYAISGILLNHKSDFNSDLKITQAHGVLEGLFPYVEGVPSKAAAFAFMKEIDPNVKMNKYYFPSEEEMVMLIRGGSNVRVDLLTGDFVYEKFEPRPVLSVLNKMHYNPSRLWTWYSDIFAVSLIIITLSGLFLPHRSKGIWGRGGIELLIGIAIPLLIFFL